MFESWHSYPSIFALGHRYVADLLKEPVLVEEKIDGSQFSFGLFEDGIRCRSKGAQLNIIAPEKMFQKAVDWVKTLPLHEGWTYRAEYVAKPKHNVLVYDRVPEKNIIIFDINTGHEAYMAYSAKQEEASRIGLEVVPHLYGGMIEDVSIIRGLLDTISCLGGQKIEGVVIKNYSRYGQDKKVLMGKFVSEKYKEVHQREWKDGNPRQKDIVNRIIEKYKTPARWQKALQHLREDGKIEDSPRDIGLLIKEVWPDIEKECKMEIMEELYKWAENHLRRGVIGGLPEWYKQVLMEKQFEKE